MDLSFAWITHYGYVAVFLLLVLGIVWLPVPDEALLTFVGYLSFKGELDLVASLLTAFLGTACGITVSYELGRLFGVRVFMRLGGAFHVPAARIVEVQASVRQWGPYGLPIAYFLPGVRHVAAVAMGASQLSLSRFWPFAYPGALLWSATFIGIGYGLGAEWNRLGPAVHRTVVITAMIVTLIVAILLRVLWRRRGGTFVMPRTSPGH
jgi:membrane protein DedA with SNARE-associated domain